MKKLLLIMALIANSSSSIFAELKYNERTQKFYSKGAARNVNQHEYHDLVISIKNRYPQGILAVTATEYASIIALLRAIGSPASKCLINDLQKIFRDALYDVMQPIVKCAKDLAKINKKH